MHGCPSCLRPYLKGEGINRKSKSWKTTSFQCRITGNQHCNGRCNHLGSTAFFVQNQRLAYKLVDIAEKGSPLLSFKREYGKTRGPWTAAAAMPAPIKGRWNGTNLVNVYWLKTPKTLKTLRVRGSLCHFSLCLCQKDHRAPKFWNW